MNEKLSPEITKPKLPEVQKKFPMLGGLILEVCQNQAQYDWVLSTSQKYKRDYLAWQTGRLVPQYRRALDTYEATGQERYFAEIYSAGDIAEQLTRIGNDYEKSIKLSVPEWGKQKKLLNALEDPNQKLNVDEIYLLSSMFGATLGRLRMISINAAQQLGRNGQHLRGKNDQYRQMLKLVATPCEMNLPKRLEEVSYEFPYSFTLPGQPVNHSSITAPCGYQRSANIGKFGHPVIRALLELRSDSELRRQLR